MIKKLNILSFSTLIFLGVLLLSLSVISAAETNMLVNVGDFVQKLTNGVPDSAKSGIGKLLLAALVVILVFSILSFVPFLDQAGQGIQWTIAVIIGLLSFLFVSPENIQFILANYEALGIAVVTILPLLIIIGFSLKIATDERYGLSWGVFISKFLIVLFIVYDIGKWLTISWDSSKPTPELAWMYPLALIIALIWFFSVRAVAKKVSHIKKEKKDEDVTTMVRNSTTNTVTVAIDQQYRIYAAEKIRTGRWPPGALAWLKSHGFNEHLMSGRDI